jgi:hypothetical protein
MAENGQTPQQAVQLGVQFGLQQVGNEIFVTLGLASGPLSVAILIPPTTARAIAKELSETALKAASTIVKPASMLAGN